jgi:hypothetical protein
MKTLTVNIEDDLAGKAVIALLDALKLEYTIGNNFTGGRSNDNSYLIEKLQQSIKDIESGKNPGIPVD